MLRRACTVEVAVYCRSSILDSIDCSFQYCTLLYDM